MIEFFEMMWLQISGLLKTFVITDLLDILLVTYLIFKFIQIIRDTRAAQLVKGIVIILVVYAIVTVFDLRLMSSLFINLFQVGLFAVFVVFQPELRSILEQLGRSKISKNILKLGLTSDEISKNDQQLKAINAVVDGCMVVRKLKMGALVVFEKETNLGEVINSGTIVDASPSSEIVGNIFFNKAPLHDGAVVIRQGKIYAAGCILPLTQNTEISSELGTRHRAAIGVSESSDAIVVVVSEETGNISIAKGGSLMRNFTKDTLRASLINALVFNEEKEKKHSGKSHKKK